MERDGRYATNWVLVARLRVEGEGSRIAVLGKYINPSLVFLSPPSYDHLYSLLRLFDTRHLAHRT